MRVGIISDTHNTLDERIHDVFLGVDRILHAGDIGTMSIIYELGAIAPVTAVTGNCDSAAMLPGIPSIAEIPLGGLRFRVVHMPEHLGFGEDGIDVYVHGHTHRPRHDILGARTILNPGSASRPRGGSARSVVVMDVADGAIERIEFIEL